MTQIHAAVANLERNLIGGGLAARVPPSLFPHSRYSARMCARVAAFPFIRAGLQVKPGPATAKVVIRRFDIPVGSK